MNTYEYGAEELTADVARGLGPSPTSCMIVSTCNRTPLLRRSLERLRELTVPDEVLIIDDGGEDGADHLAIEMAAQGMPIRYIYTHNPGHTMCSHARNVGVANSSADLIITSEPEMYFETDVIAQLIAKHLERPECFITAGTIYHEQTPGTGGCRCGCGELAHKTVNWQAVWVGLFRRQWLVDVGGWDEEFPDPWGWDDVDLGTRLRVMGIGQLVDAEVEATHMWHPPHIVNQERNEAHFAAKGFHGNESRDHPFIRANAAAVAAGTWGTPKPRS